MTIKTKIIGGLIGLLCLFIVVSLVAYNRGLHTNQRLVLVNDAFLPLFRQVVQLQSHFNGLAESFIRYYYQRPKSADSESNSFSRMVRDIYPYIIHKRLLTIERLLDRKDLQQGGPAFSKEARELIQSIKTDFNELLSLRESGDFEFRIKKIKTQLATMIKNVEEGCKNLTEDVQRENRDFLYAGISLSVLMSFAGILAILFSYRVLNPLPLLIESVKKIADGDFHQGLKVKSTDEGEVAVLAREYNKMLEALRERDRLIATQQKELLQSSTLAAIGKLSAEMVHEIRNPLNSINLNIDWLQSEMNCNDSEVGRAFKSITKEIERLGQITESYLVRARVPTQEENKTSIHEVLKEVVLFETGQDKKIKIDSKLWPEELFVRAEKGRLKQAVINLVKNAKEAMPSGGELFIATEKKRNVFEISIRDTGCGMNRVIKKKAQELFFSTKPNGTGIGLSVVRTIVEEAQGTLDIESDLGNGTNVKMQFPV